MPGPPLAGAPASAEVLFPPGMTSDERVLVGIDATGTPVSIVAVQRLGLSKLGDYSFAVPGPIADVEAAPGSDSEPGLRRDAIVWSGFSAGKKTLAARADLRVAPASKLLPLRVSLARAGDTLVIRGENTSTARAPVYVGPVSAREAAAALDETRRQSALGRAAPDLFAAVPQTPASKSEEITAPLDVRGEIGPRRFHYRLGDAGPSTFAVRIPHAAPGAKLKLVVTPEPPTGLLTPPGAPTWAEAVRRGRVDRSSLLERVSRARLTTARMLQYRTFLANPNPSGRSSAVYVYETAGRQAVKTTETSGGNAMNSTLRAALIAVLVVGGAVGLLVLWAHS